MGPRSWCECLSMSSPMTHRKGTEKIGNVGKYGHNCLPSVYDMMWLCGNIYTLHWAISIKVEWTAKMLHRDRRNQGCWRVQHHAIWMYLASFSIAWQRWSFGEKDIGTRDAPLNQKLRLGNRNLILSFGNASTRDRWVNFWGLQLKVPNKFLECIS